MKQSLFIPLHLDFWENPKLLVLAEDLKTTPETVGVCLLKLWAWAMIQRPDGKLVGVTPGSIAKVCGWTHNPQTFWTALGTHKWIDPDGYIHNWHEYAGRLQTTRDHKRVYMVDWRAKQRGQLIPASEGANPSIPVHHDIMRIRNRPDNFEEYLSYYVKTVGVDGITDNQTFEDDMIDLCAYPFEDYKEAVLAMMQQAKKKPDLKPCPNYAGGILLNWKQNGKPSDNGHGKAVPPATPTKSYKMVN